MDFDEAMITTTVKIMGIDFKVQCPASQGDELVSCANFINKRAQEIAGNSTGRHRESVLTITALNMARELIKPKHSEEKRLSLVKHDLYALKEKIKEELEI